MGLQIVLLRRNLFLPKLLFTLIGGSGECQTLLRAQQFAALLRHCNAAQNSQQLALLNVLT
ncbi:hypothetical protein GY15_31405 [Delftia sp. 670]|nr:hypothetical protein GY15_31405 [Delftia sp. 670]